MAAQIYTAVDLMFLIFTGDSSVDLRLLGCGHEGGRVPQYQLRVEDGKGDQGKEREGGNIRRRREVVSCAAASGGGVCIPLRLASLTENFDLLSPNRALSASCFRSISASPVDLEAQQRDYKLSHRVTKGKKVIM